MAEAVVRVLAGGGAGGELRIGEELVLGRGTFPDDQEISRRHARLPCRRW